MTKQTPAIELVSNLDNSNDLVLCGIDGIDRANYKLSFAQYYGIINEDCLIHKHFEFGEDNKFYYTVLSLVDNEVVRHESGFGYIYQDGPNRILKRSIPIFEGKRLDHRQLVKSISVKFVCDPSRINLLIASYPEEYAFALHDDNCVLSSKGFARPHSIQIKPHSFLARVNDSDLRSVSFVSDEFSDIVSKSIKHFSYDEKTDSLKFFDGTRWRSLQWSENEE
jgi:hypothetical protein